MPMASDTFAKDFPIFNSYGWGVSAKAERWNGRHAMFGWVFIVATGYCQAHGLIPNPSQALDFKEWGSSIFLPPVSFPIFHLSAEMRQAARPQRTKPIGE